MQVTSRPGWRVATGAYYNLLFQANNSCEDAPLGLVQGIMGAILKLRLSMSDPRVVKLARLLTTYSVAVRPEDKVLVRTALGAMPLALEVYRAVLQAGGHPHLLLHDTLLDEILFKEAGTEQLNYVSPFTALAYETFDCLISLAGASNTRALSGVKPALQQQVQRAQRHLSETFMRRQATGELRWVTTLFPTEAYAQDADMSLSEFETFVYHACYLDQDDPAAFWQASAARSQRACDWLAQRRELRVQGPDVDLRLSVAGRTWINGDGRHNMPCGEIFTGPVEASVDGWVRFTYPAIMAGREVEGVELHFAEGRVVEARARKNEAFLLEMLNTDEGARYLGEFAIGVNSGIQRFTRNILFDEKIGGTIHMALGRSYPDSGGQNVSAIHWDMICDMRQGGQIWADGELFYDSGRFLLN